MGGSAGLDFAFLVERELFAQEEILGRERVELQFSRNDVQGRRVVSVLGTAQSRKTPSVAVSSGQ